jgi:hypothetical protein
MAVQTIQTHVKRNLTEIETEAIYGLPKRQLRMMRMRGSGPRWVKTSGQIGRPGGRVLYPVDSLEEWFARRPGGGENLGVRG